MGETILKMQGIQKYFSGVHALNGVNFELRAGEVHALMGENGAGKSTLIKVLCGIHKRDGGSIELFGEEVSFNNIAESQAAGISVIHQELNMMGHLTVAQNMFIGREFKQGIFINDKKMEEEAQKLFDKMGVKIDPATKLGDLTVGKQQMVEIAKAVSRECKLLVLDEPTAALTLPEVEELFKIMNDLRAGVYDVLVGVNLLREGLDLPEVSLVAILDADKEGFLRSHRSLTQTAGREKRQRKSDHVCRHHNGQHAEDHRRDSKAAEHPDEVQPRPPHHAEADCESYQRHPARIGRLGLSKTAGDEPPGLS